MIAMKKAGIVTTSGVYVPPGKRKGKKTIGKTRTYFLKTCFIAETEAKAQNAANKAGASNAGAAAGASASGSQRTEAEKKRKKLIKSIEATLELQKRQAAGAELEANQLMKIERLPLLQKELSELTLVESGGGGSESDSAQERN